MLAHRIQRLRAYQPVLQRHIFLTDNPPPPELLFDRTLEPRQSCYKDPQYGNPISNFARLPTIPATLQIMNPSTSPPSSPLSSPLSSVASRSPSPPADYPSPPSSNVSDTGLSSLAGDATGDFPDRDGPPPAKKQKIAKPRELKTEYLDLRTLNDSPDETLHEIQDPKLKKLMEVLRKKKKVVVIAGAGISVSAGSMSSSWSNEVNSY